MGVAVMVKEAALLISIISFESSQDINEQELLAADSKTVVKY